MIVVTMMIGGFNILVDPFGLFGDKVLNWHSYNMTNNPRTAKIGYLDEHFEEYDSYIIGCSKTSSFSTDVLNKYNPGSSFYNLMMYGGDLYDIEKTAYYVIDNYNVKNIIINIGLEEAVSHNVSEDEMKSVMHSKLTDESDLMFYRKYIITNPAYSIEKIKALPERGYLPTGNDVFIAEKGVYNKSKRDIESIVNMDEYLNKNPGFTYELNPSIMYSMDLAVESIKNIKDYCEKNDVSFKLIASPVSDKELETYQVGELKAYWRKIAGVTEFWDFSGYTSISEDPRYFYDNFHFRNSVGDMALAKVFDDAEAYVPDNFGNLTNSENVEQRIVEAFDKIELEASVRNAQNEYSKDVPILMYHHIAEDADGSNDAVVSPEKFESDMMMLKQNGYTTILFKDLVDYVNYEGELPEKPILVTFDDGYESNYSYAYPVLKKLDMKATISVIGMSVGKDEYKDMGHKIKPHFTYEEAKEMYDSGVMDIQSHSFSMHEVEKYDGPDYRLGALKKENEAEEEYIEAFNSDYGQSKSLIEERVGNEVFVYTYPHGIVSDLSEVLLKESGNQVTITTQLGMNTVVKGLPQSLNAMKRINVAENTTSELLIETLGSYLVKEEQDGEHKN